MVCIDPLSDSTRRHSAACSSRHSGIVAPKSGINANAQHPWGRRLPTAPEHQRQPDVELGGDQHEAATRGLNAGVAIPQSANRGGGGVRLPRLDGVGQRPTRSGGAASFHNSADVDGPALPGYMCAPDENVVT